MATPAPSPDALPPYPEGILPPGVRSRFVEGVNGMRMHVLEAGFEPDGGTARRPCLLLLHGFPELAYSWRKVMPPLARAGYRVVAPDQRGYGRTTGWDADYDGDVASFGLLAIARDSLALIASCGGREVAAVIGHDFGAPVAAYCALARPDVFRAAVLMSAPFGGAPAAPFAAADGTDPRASASASLHQDLAALPRPRKHYHWYYSTRAANTDMWRCPQGVHAFLRAYYHYKSADWAGNRPHPLAGWSATELAKLPTYYIMDRDADMAATVAPEMPSPAAIAACRWLPEHELAVYSAEYRRTGFQGGLNWYRCGTDPRLAAPLGLYSGRTIDVPSCFVAGRSDWGVYQKPGDFERMQSRGCMRMLGCHLVEGAGHWVQQEQPEATADLLLDFLARADR